MTTGKDWYEFECVVRNPRGMHGRPVTEASSFAKKYSGDVELHYNGGVYDPKSIFSLMNAALAFGAKVKVRVERGEGCEEFGKGLKDLIEQAWD